MLTVGQKLWLVPREKHYGQPREVEVTKIGRKWANISGYYRGGRININTLEVDGGEYTCPGQCYLSREEYEQAALKSAMWARLVSRMRDTYRIPPDGVTAEDIAAAATLLNIGLEAECKR